MKETGDRRQETGDRRQETGDTIFNSFPFPFYLFPFPFPLFPSTFILYPFNSQYIDGITVVLYHKVIGAELGIRNYKEQAAIINWANNL